VAVAQPVAKPAPGQEPLAPTTTGEQDLQTAGVREAASLQTLGTRQAMVLSTEGQRRINLIWEITQAIIAVIVTAMTLVVAAVLVIRGDGGEGAFLLMSNAFFVVISTYLARTNHTKTGGVPSEQRRGE
jgi:hypothetical protein